MDNRARHQAVLITGANGEMGHGLIQALARQNVDLVAVDLHPLDPSLRSMVRAHQAGDILDTQLMQRLVSQYEVTTIFHLAALLSTRAEFSPEIAHRVNVTGTLELLRLAHQQSTWSGVRTKFIFPSSIAAYGVAGKKDSLDALKEHEYTQPTTMYGCNKVYCEHLGRYFAEYYQQLAAEPSKGGVDFRCIRFPGLISADTVPSGGTSDFGPEMIHAAAQGQPYACFVRPDTTIPFMAMPDGVQALLDLYAAPEEALSQRVYNINAFSCSAQDFCDEVHKHFEAPQVSFVPHLKRQAIVDSWPAAVNDAPARRDWGFSPQYDLQTAFNDYLVPRISARYRADGGR
ncbi:MAG: NAD-dependent epimerase/dehydratase family protein [Myxococcota bacterium]|nr:NAD-dependent epimerase/dehydratase family protein [Myxococcota bacterium]